MNLFVLFEITAFYIARLQTVEKTFDVTESLKKMQDQLHCCDDLLKEWIADVKQWASPGCFQHSYMLGLYF